MRFMFGVGTRVFHAEFSTGRWESDDSAEEPAQEDTPAYFDVSGALLDRRPQVDHEPPVVQAMGFQPNNPRSK